MSNKRTIGRYRKLFSDTAAFIISNFASKVLVFLLIPLYTSVLTTEEYGIADLITNTINVLYPILTLSIMEATLRFTFDTDICKEDVLVNSLFVITLSEIAVLLFTPFIKYIGGNIQEYWIWFVIIFGGSNLQQVLSQYTKGIGKTKIFAISGVVQTIVIIIFNIVGLLVFKLGLFAYFLAIASGYYFNCLYLILAAPIRVRKGKINIALLKEMLRFSIPTIPTIIAWWINTSADKYVIIGYLGIAASGLYSVAYKIPSILTMFTNIFTSAWTLSAIQSVEDKDSDKFQSNIFKYFNAINVLACSALILLSKVLAKVLFAKEFYEAWQYVPLLLVAYVFSGLAGFLASSFRAAKYTKGLFSSTVIGALINIILNFFIVKKYGIMGAAFTTVIGFAVTFYIRSYSVKKIIDIKINLKKDTCIYLLLILQAFIMAFDIRSSYVFGIISFLIIFFVYKKMFMNLISKIMTIIKNILNK